MAELLRKWVDDAETVSTKDIILVGSGLEILRDIRDRIEDLSMRIVNLERKFDERVSEKVLSENKFLNEVKGGDDIVDTIVREIREVTRPLIATKEKLTIVETRRIEKVIAILKRHEKLNSLQLGQVMGLSRTRCNEYLKQMENIGLVDGEILGKEKYYKLKV